MRIQKESTNELQVANESEEGKIDISLADITVSDFPYSFMYGEPTPTVTYNGEQLMSGKDFSFYLTSGYLDESGHWRDVYKYDSYEDTFSFRPGVNTYVIKGINDYAGVVSIPITVRYAGITRIAGKNRYDTAAQLCSSVKNYLNRYDRKVVLACGDNYPDALAASSLGRFILLTTKDRLSEEARTVLAANDIEGVFVLGDDDAISDTVVQEVEELGLSTTRLAGKDRIATCLAIFDQVQADHTNATIDSVIIVNGYSFPDALSIASYASDTGCPILFTTKTGCLSADEVEKLHALGRDLQIVVVGGDRSVDLEAISAQLGDQHTYSYQRLAGANRYETSAAVVKWTCMSESEARQAFTSLRRGGHDGSYDPYVVTGKNFPDALAAAFPAAIMDSPVVLVDEGHLEALDYLAECEHRVGQVHIVGGSSSISDSLASEIDARIEASWS